MMYKEYRCPDCKGKMVPIDIRADMEVKTKRGWAKLYQCEKCRGVGFELIN